MPRARLRRPTSSARARDRPALCTGGPCEGLPRAALRRGRCGADAVRCRGFGDPGVQRRAVRRGITPSSARPTSRWSKPCWDSPRETRFRRLWTTVSTPAPAAVSRIVRVQNLGTLPMFVRVMLSVEGVRPNGDALSLDHAVTYDFGDASAWQRGQDGSVLPGRRAGTRPNHARADRLVRGGGGRAGRHRSAEAGDQGRRRAKRAQVTQPVP